MMRKCAAICFRCPTCSRRRVFILLTLIVAMVTLFHFFLLPKWSGAYNQPCQLTPQQLEDMRHMVRNIVTIYEDMNITYWLDFGTLLGAVRTGDILRHDGDADISRVIPERGRYSLSEFRSRLHDEGIEANSVIASYKGLTVDLHLWKEYDGEFDGKPQRMLQRYFSQRIQKELTVVDRTYDKFVRLPRSWVVPMKKVDYIGVKAKIPKEYDRVLKNRYPFTYFKTFSLTVPYKWKCWVPFM